MFRLPVSHSVSYFPACSRLTCVINILLVPYASRIVAYTASTWLLSLR
jgi:hypothetical protein